MVEQFVGQRVCTGNWPVSATGLAWQTQCKWHRYTPHVFYYLKVLSISPQFIAVLHQPHR